MRNLAHRARRLVQVIEGVMRLGGTLRHAPLVFQLVRMRQRLAAASELYIPCSGALLAVLRSPLLFKMATSSTEAPPHIPSILRLAAKQVEEGRAQGAVVAEALRLLGQEMDLYRYSVAFPELVVPVLGSLRKFVKSTRVAKWKMVARGLIETLQTRATWAATRRVELKLEAGEAAGIEVLRPEGEPNVRERLGASEAEVEKGDDVMGALPISSGPNKPEKKKPSRANATKPKGSRDITSGGKGHLSDENEDEDDGDGGDGYNDEDDDGDGDGGGEDDGKASKHRKDSRQRPSKARALASSATREKGVSRGTGRVQPGGADGLSAPDVVEDMRDWSDED